MRMQRSELRSDASEASSTELWWGHGGEAPVKISQKLLDVRRSEGGWIVCERSELRTGLRNVWVFAYDALAISRWPNFFLTMQYDTFWPLIMRYTFQNAFSEDIFFTCDPMRYEVAAVPKMIILPSWLYFSLFSRVLGEGDSVKASPSFKHLGKYSKKNY